MTTPHWRSFLPVEEKRVYDSAGFSQPDELGKKPALLVIDCTVAFTGRSGDLPIEEAVREFPTACGPAAWAALPNVRLLIETFREHQLPIVYTRADLAAGQAVGRATKAGGRRDPEMIARGNVFPDVIEPQPGEWVLAKGRASAFFGTPLSSYLVTRAVDSLVVCGATTSGCVRASVVDAFSHGFVTFVVEEACFDRSATAHAANLWDMNAKYASVVPMSDTLRLIPAPA